MFITRKRLEEIKSDERWKREIELNKEREMTEMWTKLYELQDEVHRLRAEVDSLNFERKGLKSGTLAKPEEVVITPYIERK